MVGVLAFGVLALGLPVEFPGVSVEGILLRCVAFFEGAGGLGETVVCADRCAERSSGKASQASKANAIQTQTPG